MITVTWRAYKPGCYYPGSMEPQEFLIFEAWAEAKECGPQITEYIAKEWLSDPFEWNEWFGDANDAAVMIEIIAPDSIAGHYLVRVGKRIIAKSERGGLP